MLTTDYRRSHHGEVANVLDYDIVESDFKRQSCDNIHFRSNAPEKSMKPLIPPESG